MAKKNTIAQKIVLEGEKEYSARIKEASRNLKTLQSQLKAETAELGKNATAQQKNELRTKNLQQQIAEQEKVVKTLREALKQAQEQYSDNEDVIARWEQKLNSARTTLANMRNGLADAGGGFQQIASDANTAVTAANSVADSFEKLASVGESISGALEKAFTGAVSAVREAVTAVWGEIADLAAKSNNTVDLAGYWNTSATNIQKYAGAVQYASGNLDDLNQLVTKINSADPKKIAELTGVSSEGYEDMWEYAMAVMDSLSLMDKQARNKAGFEIFGRGATKMFDLANDWQTVKDNLWRFDAETGGLGLSEESMQKMSTLYDRINGIKANWQALKEMAVLSLTGDLAMNLTGNVQAILDALKKYLDADSDEERQAAIKEIEDNIVAMFDAVKKAIEEGLAKMDELAAELQKSDNPAVKAVGDIMAGLVDALKWLTEDNMKHVIGALELLAGFWAGAKVLSMVATIGKFAASLSTIKTFKLTSQMTSLLTQGAGAAGTAGTVVGDGEAAGIGAKIGNAIVSVLSNKALMIGTGIGTFILATLKPSDTGNDDITDQSGELTETGKQLLEEGLIEVGENGEVTSNENRGTVTFDVGTGEWGWQKDTGAKGGGVGGGAGKTAEEALQEAVYASGKHKTVTIDLTTGEWGMTEGVSAKGGGVGGTAGKTAEEALTDANRERLNTPLIPLLEDAWKDGLAGITGLPGAINEGIVQPVAGFVGGQVDNALRFWSEQGDNTGRFWGGVWNDTTNWVQRLGQSVSEGLARWFEDPEEKRKRNEEIDQAEMGYTPSGPMIVAEVKTEEVWEDLDKDVSEVSKVGYTLAEQIHAIDEWWDEYMALYNGTGDEDRENELFNAMQEALGDQFGDTWDEIIRTLDEMGDGAYSMYDIPPSWWQNLNTDGITQGDVAGLNNTLGTLGRMVLEGASAGVSKGISGIQVSMDGQRVGELVAPYVSRHIAYTIM